MEPGDSYTRQAELLIEMVKQRRTTLEICLWQINPKVLKELTKSLL